MNIHIRSISSLSLLVLSLGSCVSESATAPKPPPGMFAMNARAEGISILALEPGHPEYFNPEVSFWATVGEDTQGVIYFRGNEDPTKRGEAYARLRVRPGSLLAYPDGRLFAPGDSVLISMRVVDPDHFLLEMQPSGLRFSTSRPAELRIEYAHADSDYNDDGDVDDEDKATQHGMNIWQQEEPGEPFVTAASMNLEDIHELKAQVFTFSRFAIAY